MGLLTLILYLCLVNYTPGQPAYIMGWGSYPYLYNTEFSLQVSFFYFDPFIEILNKCQKQRFWCPHFLDKNNINFKF